MDNRKTKYLYCKADCGITIHVTCRYNPKTDHIRIASGFVNSGNNRAQTNKNCSQYLGVTIAEKILSKIFNNVNRMVYTNPGYDFICNKDYKIDVKSRALNKNQWCFDIKRNTVADYFLCLAFDNRTDLNPQHLWLIPGEILNDKMSATISISTVDKWSIYELTGKLDDVIICCDTLKE